MTSRALKNAGPEISLLDPIFEFAPSLVAGPAGPEHTYLKSNRKYTNLLGPGWFAPIGMVKPRAPGASSTLTVYGAPGFAAPEGGR